MVRWRKEKLVGQETCKSKEKDSSKKEGLVISGCYYAEVKKYENGKNIGICFSNQVICTFEKVRKMQEGKSHILC